ncbi:MAG: choice-of-anchor D domain-containing protein, partial [Planctomycetaceae bacterium]
GWLYLGTPSLTSGFSLGSDTFVTSLAPGSSDSFAVNFSSSTATTINGTITIANNDSDESPYSFAVKAVVTGTPEINVLGNGVSILDGDSTPSTTDGTDFGSVVPGSIISQTFTVQNTGNATLYLGPPAFTGGFTTGSDPLVTSLAPGASDTFSVNFSSSVAATYTGQVSFSNNDNDESPYNFIVKAVVIAPEIDVLGNGVSIVDGDTTPSTSDDTDFGTVLINTPEFRTFTVKNTGMAPLYLGTPSVTGGFFRLAANYIVSPLAINSSATFVVEFLSSVAGTFVGQISIGNNDSDESPYEFAVKAVVTGNPEITVTATDPNASEAGPNTGTYTFSRSGDSSAVLTVNFNVTGTATSGTDYTAFGTSVTFAANQATKTLTLTPIDDYLAEADETAIVTLATGSGYTVGSPSSATVTIADDDPHEIDADDDFATTNEDTPVGIYPLENDSDSAGHSLTVVNVVSTHGVATVNGSGVLTFVPSLNFHGIATVTYQAFDGLLFSNTATIYIDVASVNDAPTITNPGNATFTEGDNVSVYVPAADVDLPNDFLTWSATGMPPGMVIQIVTGRLLGKLTYASAGTYNLTVTVSDAAGATASTTFEWTIQDAGFDTLTATESHGFLLPNSITVPGATTILYVAPLNDVSLSVAAFAPKALATLDDVRYVVTGGATPAAGDFNPTPVITVGAAGAIHVVTAWLDENSNSQIDAGEFSLSLTIQVVDLDSALVNANRVAGGALYPGENSYVIKAGELFDVTSTFQYTLVPGAATRIGPGAIIRGQLRTPAGGVIVNSPGIGLNFSVLLTAAMVGPAEVRFYVDANFSGTYDTSEVYRDSEPFQILERNQLTYTYMISSNVTALTSLTISARAAAVQAAVDIGVVRLLAKNSDDDWRAAVIITALPYGDIIFTPDASRPDPADTDAKIQLHFNQDYRFTIVSDLDSDGNAANGKLRGKASGIPGDSFIVNWSLKRDDTIVHEIGHLRGISHEMIDPMVIMAAGTVPRSPSANKARFDDAEKYSNVSSSSNSADMHDEESHVQPDEVTATYFRPSLVNSSLIALSFERYDDWQYGSLARHVLVVLRNWDRVRRIPVARAKFFRGKIDHSSNSSRQQITTNSSLVYGSSAIQLDFQGLRDSVTIDGIETIDNNTVGSRNIREIAKSIGTSESEIPVDRNSPRDEIGGTER